LEGVVEEEEEEASYRVDGNHHQDKREEVEQDVGAWERRFHFCDDGSSNHG